MVPSLERAAVGGKTGLGWKALEDYIPGWKWDLWKNGSDAAAMSEKKREDQKQFLVSVLLCF